MLKVIMGLIALLVCGNALAEEDQAIEKPLVAQTLEGFTRESAQIRDGMQPGGRYEFLKPADRSKVEARLNTMQALLQNHATQNDLSARDKLTLVNAQEDVNGVLKHNDSNRLVCERRAPVGSHIPVNTCRRFGDIEEERREAMKGVSDMNQSSRRPPTANGGH